MKEIKEIFKRYMTAFIFLLIVTVLMLAGTMGVMSLGDKMVEEMGEHMQPRGENLIK